MSATDTLNSVRTLLGLDTKLEQMKLENGTILEADKFEADQPVFIVTDDEKVALPIGSYKMENGFTLSVEKDGVIASLEEVSEETEEEVETEEEEKEMGYVSRDEFEMALQEIKKMIDDLRPEDEEEKVEEEVKEEEVEEELSSETAELKAELSKPASAPIKHNPEASTEKTRNFKFAQNRKKTTFDLVLEKISKIKN
jgi:hypothetical protein